MAVFDHPEFDDHEQVVFASDPIAGLRAIIAIHNTNLGPAVGGCRIWPYASEADAIADALRLSKGMTLKSSISGLAFGGGKAVVIADSRTDKTPELFRALGDVIERLGGAYVTAEDVGTSPQDLEIVRTRTRHVAGIAEGGAGDPSPVTAFGVFVGIKAAVRRKLERDDLMGVRVAVQGLGHVGYAVARQLADAGAKLVVADINRDRVERVVEEIGAEAAQADEIHKANVDVFCPCALGAVLNERTIPELKAQIVAGSANNQLETATDGERLMRRGVLYAPDYVINAGGIINIAMEGANYDPAKAYDQVGRIEGTLMEIFDRADRDGIATAAAADELARARYLGTAAAAD